MVRADSIGWFVRFAMTFAILFALCWQAPRVFRDIPQFPPTTTGEEQVATLQRYFQLPVQDVALVGSSLAYRLKEQFFEHGGIRNAAITGGSPLTGLALIDASPSLRPRVIAVETNVLNRGIDDRLFQKFKDARRPDDTLRPLRSLAAYYQSVQDDALTYDAARRRSILDRPPATYDIEQAMTDALVEWNRPIYREAILRDTNTLKSLVEKLEAKGVTIVFFEMPYPAKMENAGYPTTIREILTQVFGPENSRWLKVEYPAGELRWYDPNHLDDRSAIIFASALDIAIRKKRLAH
jgi:hypothetical protein